MIIKDLEINKTLDREALTKIIGKGSFSFAKKRLKPSDKKKLKLGTKGLLQFDIQIGTSK